MNERMAILVASPDSYADAFRVYLKCYRKYASDCPYELILSTNTNTYEGITVLNNNALEDNWTDRALVALKHIRSKYILTMCDDDFIVAPIDYQKIERILDDMDQYHLNVCEFHNSYDGILVHPDSLLRRVNRRCPWAKNLMVTIYNREYLINELGDGTETGWQVEERWYNAAQNAPDEYFEDVVSVKERIIPYVHTITKGKWNPFALNELKALGIEIDSTRGVLPYSYLLKRAIRRYIGKCLSPKLKQNIKKMLRMK